MNENAQNFDDYPSEDEEFPHTQPPHKNKSKISNKRKTTIELDIDDKHNSKKSKSLSIPEKLTSIDPNKTLAVYHFLDSLDPIIQEYLNLIEKVNLLPIIPE